jgi:hypothetical protein
MYQLEATLYELNGYVRIHGTLSFERQGEQEVLSSAHLNLPFRANEPEMSHDLIFEAIRDLCHELAENSNPTLF